MDAVQTGPLRAPPRPSGAAGGLDDDRISGIFIAPRILFGLESVGMTLNLDLALEQLYRGELLSELTVKEICERLKETMIYQSNVQIVQAPVTIVGDIHGHVACPSFFPLLLPSATCNVLRRFYSPF